MSASTCCRTCCIVVLVWWLGTGIWTFSFRRKREGGQEAQRPVLWYRRPMVRHASMTVSWIGLRVVESTALEKDLFVEAAPSSLRYLIAVFTRAMQTEKVKWRSPRPPWWRGV